MVELAREGSIDILLTPTAKMSVSLPSVQYADLPFLFPSREDAYELLDGEPGKMILKQLDRIGLLGVTFWENGFKHFTANAPLLTPDDFKGKKIRIMKSRIIMEQFKALGAKPVPIDFHATKKALEDRVVDGQENPLVAIVNMDFHKVQSNLTLSEHAYLPYIFSLSKKTLLNLPLEVQTLLIETGKKVTPWERKETQKREKLFLDELKKEGVKINTLTKKQKEQFQNKTKYIIKAYEDVIGSDIISKTEDILYNKYKPSDTIVFGINVNLSIGSRNAGLAIKRGVELAADKINSQGGLLGKKVVVIAKDHKNISTQGIKNIRLFLSNSDVKAIIGGKQSAIIAGEVKYIQKGKKPYISPWAASSKIIDNEYEQNYLFRVSANDKFITKKLFNEVIRNHHHPLLLVENSIWGRGALKSIDELALKQKIDPLPSLVINRGEKDFSTLIEKIKRGEFDSILMIVNSSEGTNVIKAFSKNGILIPVVSHWGITGGEFYKKNKEYLKKIDLRFIQSFSFVNNTDPKAKELYFSYLKKYGKKSLKDIHAPNAVAQAFDSALLLAEAIKKANSFEGGKIKKHLETIKELKGVIKTYENPFDSRDHEALEENDFFFAEFNKDGIIVPMKKQKSKYEK
jgi:tripartite ATP-independent transporter DctP family solute receptor